MWIGILLSVVGIGVGIIIGFNIPVIILPQDYAKYMSVAALAALDSVFGGIRAAIEDKFDHIIFVSGFFSNALLAAGLTFLGDRLGIEHFYMAAVVAFGVRLFQNLAIIRRHVIENKINK